MPIAIIGSGFAGLALSYYLAQKTKTPITCFNHTLGASGAASGLLHPFGGAQCRKTWMADRGMKETMELLKASEKALGQSVASYTGILRPALNEKQKNDFYNASLQNDDVSWFEKEYCDKEYPYLAPMLGALMIHSGITVYSPKYLEGLTLCCKQLNVRFESKEIHSLAELKEFDIIIVATGSGTTAIAELSGLPLMIIKGQVIEVAWQEGLPKLPCSLVSNGYITMNPDRSSCFIGSTYERGYKTPFPDVEVAAKELVPKLASLIPSLANAPIIGCKAGLRMFSPDNLTPVAGKIKHLKSTWILSGLGSKGLIHHAWLAKELASAVLEDNPEILPKEVRFRLEKS